MRHAPAPLALTIALALLAGACATPTRKALSGEHRAAITLVKAVGNVSQHEVATSIESSTTGVAAGAGFGLVGALIGGLFDAAIESGRQGTADSAAAPLRELLAGHDPRPGVKAALEQELGRSTTFQTSEVELGQERLDRSALTALIASADADAVLVVDFRYALTQDFGHMVVTGVASLLPTRSATAPVLKQAASLPSSDVLPTPPLYRETFVTSLPAPAGGPSIGRWVDDGGAAARLAIDGGMAEIVRMLAWDLDRPGPQGALYDGPEASARGLEQFGLSHRWFPVRASEGRSWFRASTGELASTGDGYPAAAAAALVARAGPGIAKERPTPPPPAELPTPDPAGGISFEFATADLTRQGGAVSVNKYSEREGDVWSRGATLDGGVLTVKGQVGFGRGSAWAGLGPRWELLPGAAPLDARGFRSVTFRLAASARSLRVNLVGKDHATQVIGCYPVHELEVSEQMREYTIPFAKFRLLGHCGSKGRDVRETLPALNYFEVVSTHLSQAPLWLSVGPTTLNR